MEPKYHTTRPQIGLFGYEDKRFRQSIDSLQLLTRPQVSNFTIVKQTMTPIHTQHSKHIEESYSAETGPLLRFLYSDNSTERKHTRLIYGSRSIVNWIKVRVHNEIANLASAISRRQTFLIN